MTSLRLTRVRGPAAILGFSLAMVGVAHGDPIGGSDDQFWYQFSFTAAGIQARGCFPKDADPTALDCRPSSFLFISSNFAPAPPWTFTTSGNVILIVTDAFLAGDSFGIFDNGTFVGRTPEVPPLGGCGPDPNACSADPTVSQASFLLTPLLTPGGSGSHQLTIVPASVSNPGAGYFQVRCPTDPEPGEDADLDGVADWCDNCVLRPNPFQTDADYDECGNFCDGDFNQDGVSGGPDFNTFRQCFGRRPPVSNGPEDDPTCYESDMDWNGVVGGPDFNLHRLSFGKPPGPGAACPF